jgi:opacity protein-like surface antigen
MNSNRSSYLLGAALGTAFVLGLGGNAVADEDISSYGGGLKGGYDVPPPPPSDRGIYFKAYVGQANTDVGNIWTPGYETNSFSVFHKDIKSNALYGLGIGYKRNHWLRFDLTGEYRGDTTFFGQDAYPGGVGFGAGANEYTADVSTWLGLGNAYWDIITWCGFTPYVGAGIGFATISVDGLKDINPVQGAAYYGADSTKTNFAWALHAGLAYDVSPQFAIDLAYRYANLGSAQSGIVSDATGANSPYAKLAIRDITSNDVMLGVRYKLQREQPVMYAVK